MIKARPAPIPAARARGGAVAARSPAYEGAANSRRFGGWRPTNASAPAIWNGNAETLRSRARDLERNTPLGARIPIRLAAAIVGTGAWPQFETRFPRRNRDLGAAFKAWARDRRACDYGERLTFPAIQALVVATEVVDGESFIRLRWVDEGAHPLRLQVIPADQVDAAYSVGRRRDGTRIVNGIELDDRDRPIAYHVLTTHPGEGWRAWVNRSRERVRVEARDMIHHYRVRRVGQVRGLSTYAAILGVLRDLDTLDIADLEKAKIQATLAAIVSQSGVDDLVDEVAAGGGEGIIGEVSPLVDGSGRPVETIDNGTVMYAPDGRAVTLVQAPASSQNEGTREQFQRQLAVGVGLTYMSLTGDVSRANFSSMKAGENTHRADVDAYREHVLVPGFLAPLLEAWVIGAVLVGLVPTTDAPASWSYPRHPTIDREKDTRADVADCEAGFALQPDVLRERGYDPIQYLDDAVEWRKELEARKIPVPEWLGGPPRAKSAAAPAGDSAPPDPATADGTDPAPVSTGADASATGSA